jgi:hypothetical protein
VGDGLVALDFVTAYYVCVEFAVGSLFLVVCTASFGGVTQDIRKRLFFGDWRETLVVFFGASVESFFWRFQWPLGLSWWWDLLIVMIIGGLSCRRW